MEEDFLEELKIRQKIDKQFEDEAKEGMYILQEYGLHAFLDMTASTSDYPRARRILNRMLRTLERLERYEDCGYIVNVILPVLK
jgi:hypothetical protein